MTKLVEDVSVLKLYEEDVDGFMDYLMKSKIDNKLSLKYSEDNDEYHLTYHCPKVTQVALEKVVKKIKDYWKYEIDAKTFVKLSSGDRFSTNYKYHNGYVMFSSELVFHLFDLSIKELFGNSLVSHEVEKDFSLIIYRGNVHDDIVSFLSYQELTK